MMVRRFLTTKLSHRWSLLLKATCELVKGAEDPTSTKLGDLSDDGTNKSDYANSFCDRYDEIVEKINDSGVLGEESGQLTEPYVYTTSSPDDKCD